MYPEYFRDDASKVKLLFICLVQNNFHIKARAFIIYVNAYIYLLNQRL